MPHRFGVLLKFASDVEQCFKSSMKDRCEVDVLAAVEFLKPGG